jgi:hypothetical protein
MPSVLMTSYANIFTLFAVCGLICSRKNNVEGSTAREQAVVGNLPSRLGAISFLIAAANTAFAQPLLGVALKKAIMCIPSM